MAGKGKGAASSEKAPSVDELVDELSAPVAMHERSPLQLQGLHSFLQAVTAKAAAAEKVAAERAAAERAAVEKAAAEKAAAEKAAAKKEPSGPAPDAAVQLAKARALEKPLVVTPEPKTHARRGVHAGVQLGWLKHFVHPRSSTPSLHRQAELKAAAAA